MGTEEGHKDNWRAGASLLWNEGGRAEVVQLGEKKTLGRTHAGFQYIKRAYEKDSKNF